MEVAGPSRAVENIPAPVISSEETPTHALLNSLVLSIIVDYCHPSTLRAFRVQCKAWNEAARRPFRAYTPVHLHSLDYSQEQSITEQNCFTTLYDVLVLNQHMDPLKFKKNPFHHLILHFGVSLDSSHLQRFFFIRIGPWLKTLRLHKVTLTPSSFQHLIFTFTPNLEELVYQDCKNTTEQVFHSRNVQNFTCDQRDQQTNLKSIHISMQSGYTKAANPFPICWTDFFLRFPNLKSLKLEAFPYSTARVSFANIINAIVNIREANENQVLNLTTFDVQNFIFVEQEKDPNKKIEWPNYITCQTAAVNPNIMPKMIQICSSLHTLTLIINGLNGEQLSQILESCFSLINLKLEQHPFLFEISNFRYDSIPKALQKLDLYGVVFNTWEFLAYIPNVTQLNIQISHEKAWIELPCKLNIFPSPLKHLTSFWIFVKDPYFNKHARTYTSFFGNVMTKLKRLHIPMYMSWVENVSRNWPYLEELEMTKNVAMPMHRVADSLKALKRIKVLKITSEDDYSNYFEPRHVRNVFLQMPTLKSLSASFHQDDVAAFRLLTARVENTDGCVVKIPVGVDHEKQFFEDLPLKNYLEYIDKGMTDKEIQAASKKIFREGPIYKDMMAKYGERDIFPNFF